MLGTQTRGARMEGSDESTELWRHPNVENFSGPFLSVLNVLYFFFCRYFTDGLQTIEHFGTYIQDLMNRLTLIRSEQEEEKRDLVDIRNTLKNSPGFNKVVRVVQKLV